MSLLYLKDSRFELIAYSDADHAGCKDDFKITIGGLQFLGEKLMSWSSKKQDCTAMSTVEAEYVSLSACCAQVIWMQTPLLDYGYNYNKILMFCDSKSFISTSCNPGGVSCCLELSVGEEDLLTLEVPALKNSSYKGPKRRSNSCYDGAVVSAEGETCCN
ncbi:hypothetical protein Tco_0692778 [Tanacetum coccineum]